MIKVSVFYDAQNRINGFKLCGHAGYAEAGYDIICASVSILAINTVNSIEKFTDDTFTYQEEESKGSMELHMTSFSEKSQVLLQAFALGIGDIESEYGKKYIRLKNELNP